MGVRVQCQLGCLEVTSVADKEAFVELMGSYYWEHLEGITLVGQTDSNAVVERIETHDHAFRFGRYRHRLPTAGEI